MKPLVVFLDAGHGGMLDGVYATAGKRSPTFDDGEILFEGVFNRQVVKSIAERLGSYSPNEILVQHVYDEEKDTPLSERVKKANETYLNMGRPTSIYISVHANAFGTEWNSAKGIEVFTSFGQTRSDIFSNILIEELEKKLDAKFRTDFSDGDSDKEAHFYVLRKTLMPAVLSENGFMTNKEECKKMFTSDYVNDVALAHYLAIMKYRKLYM